MDRESQGHSPPNLYQQPDVPRLLQAAGAHLPAYVAQVLARLCRLEGVPFNHLVPDARMLPPESIRFFYLDFNWIDSLIDGALCIGMHSSLDQQHMEVMRHLVRTQARQVATAVHGQDAISSAPAAPEPEPPWTGLLLRSAIVSECPGLQIIACDAAGEQILPLRQQALSADVLLCIFGGMPAQVKVSQPPQSLRFGVGNGTVTLRSLQPEQVGAQLDTRVTAACRDEGLRVLDVRKIQKDMETALRSEHALADRDGQAANALTPGGFAVQMVKSPLRKTYRLPWVAQQVE